MKLGALAQRAFADLGVLGESLVNARAVVGAIAELEGVLVDEPAGGVVGLKPRAVDFLAPLDDDGDHGIAQLGVSLRRRSGCARGHAGAGWGGCSECA